MTLDEAIKHAEKVANANERLCKTVPPAMQLFDYGKCAEENRQLAEWLNDYKRLLEQKPCEDCISRQQVKSDYADWYGYGYKDNWFYKHLSSITPVTPQPKTGHWIEHPNDYECSECHIIRAKGRTGKYNYCPNCGADMRGDEN